MGILLKNTPPEIAEIARAALATRPPGSDPRGIALALGLRLLPVPDDGPPTSTERLVYRHSADPEQLRENVRVELARALLLREEGTGEVDAGRHRALIVALRS